MFDLARGLVERGHEVTAFTTDVLDGEHRARPRREAIDGIKVERFPNLSNGLAWRAKKYLPPGLVVATARRVREFDVVHATDVRTIATAAAYLASRRAGVPFCLSAHGSLPGSSGVRGLIKRAYDDVLVQPMLASAALLFAQTRHEAELYLQAGAHGQRVRTLPLPIDLASIPDSPARGFLRERLQIDARVPVVLFLGRIHGLKGLDLLVDALEPMLAAGAAVLVVAGRDDGALETIASQHAGLLASGALSFVVPIYGEDRFRAYADADVFCLTPRHWEETSLASLEAAAVGTPVVVSQQAEIPGLPAVPLEPDAVRAAVRDALAQPDAGGRVRRVATRLEGYLLDLVSSA